jgi:hypothetical protein
VRHGNSRENFQFIVGKFSLRGNQALATFANPLLALHKPRKRLPLVPRANGLRLELGQTRTVTRTWSGCQSTRTLISVWHSRQVPAAVDVDPETFSEGDLSDEDEDSDSESPDDILARRVLTFSKPHDDLGAPCHPAAVLPKEDRQSVSAEDARAAFSI